LAKVWFVTGAGRGFGRAVARAALERGDRVAASTLTNENLAGLAGEFGDNVLPLALDVRDRDAAIRAVAAAKQRFGRIDGAPSPLPPPRRPTPDPSRPSAGRQAGRSGQAWEGSETCRALSLSKGEDSRSGVGIPSTSAGHAALSSPHS